MGEIVVNSLQSGVICLVAAYIIEAFGAKQLAKMVQILAVIYIAQGILTPFIAITGKAEQIANQIEKWSQIPANNTPGGYFWKLITKFPTGGIPNGR